jgi:NAD(P)-dependent dehydrogenase (short-subunit alcohol dehydrogenase family)
MTHKDTPRTWFITGAGRGLGRAFATAALERGDSVAATGRDSSALDDLRARFGDRLLPLTLDVTRRGDARSAVSAAADRMGRLDIVVNNAGYGQFGAVEELSEDDMRSQLETNVLGALWVSQAAVPVMREQGGGHIVQVSSLGGIGAFANLGAYNASKWALEAFSESMSIEVAPFGIDVTIVEPGGFATDWAGSSARNSAPLAAYDPMRKQAAARRGGQASGRPEDAAVALLRLVDSPEPPLRAILGRQATGVARGIYERRLAEWDEWAWVNDAR